MKQNHLKQAAAATIVLHLLPPPSPMRKRALSCLVPRRTNVLIAPCQRYSMENALFFRTQDPKISVSSSVDDPASTAGISDKVLKAPFQKVSNGKPPLFPWRHSAEKLPRLDRHSEEFARKGQLLGKHVYSDHPLMDGLAAAWIFLNVPWYKMLVYRDWQYETAENMSWAFSQGVSGILSNVYKVPMEDIVTDAAAFSFETNASDESVTGEDDASSIGDNELDNMVQENLRKLYQAAHEFGKDQLQIRLECRPKSAKMYHLFVFPFLSRGNLKRDPGFQEKYEDLLYLTSALPREALPIYQDLMSDMQRRGFAESTVICQVEVKCDELFWVKDLSTGRVVQGSEDEEFREVSHLVRMEMVVTTVLKKNSFIPFEMIPGQWQITDIDDHLDGNMMV